MGVSLYRDTPIYKDISTYSESLQYKDMFTYGYEFWNCKSVVREDSSTKTN